MLPELTVLQLKGCDIKICHLVLFCTCYRFTPTFEIMSHPVNIILHVTTRATGTLNSVRIEQNLILSNFTKILWSYAITYYVVKCIKFLLNFTVDIVIIFIFDEFYNN